jgi:hypothetical protein
MMEDLEAAKSNASEADKAKERPATHCFAEY